jgi:hypothetical protein
MPALKFDMSEEGFARVQQKQITIKQFIENVLTKDKGSALTAIAPWLVAFHQQGGGAPVVSEIKIADAEYNFTALSGKVKLAYKVTFTYGCADIFRTDDFAETSNFTIDPQTNKLTLLITDQLTRDTIDEF